MEKTNVMRLLERAQIPYAYHSYAHTDAVSGLEVAKILEKSPDQVFKTLVTKGKSGQHYVFVIPVSRELDLKKSAAAVGEKSVEMIKSKDLLSLTGYIHGGCSPIGLKKVFPTLLHLSAQSCGTIIFSAGRIGYQVELTPQDFFKIVRCTYADLVI